MLLCVSFISPVNIILIRTSCKHSDVHICTCVNDIIVSCINSPVAIVLVRKCHMFLVYNFKHHKLASVLSQDFMRVKHTRQLSTTTHENKRCHHISGQMMFTKLHHFNKAVLLFQESDVISGLIPLSVLPSTKLALKLD